jgi:hypothetical protein
VTYKIDVDPAARDHQGVVTYLILEEQRRVDVLQVMWLG